MLAARKRAFFHAIQVAKAWHKENTCGIRSPLPQASEERRKMSRNLQSRREEHLVQGAGIECGEGEEPKDGLDENNDLAC